jgi:hypothetical protein
LPAGPSPTGQDARNPVDQAKRLIHLLIVALVGRLLAWKVRPTRRGLSRHLGLVGF